MNATAYKDHPPPTAEIERLIAEHGARAILFAVLRRALRRAPGPAVGTDRLSDHLRRDIGLPAAPPGRKYWELR